MINRQIEVPQEVDLASLFGNFDENIKMLDKALSVNIASRDNALRVTGEEENVEKASQVINMLMQIIARGEIIDQQKVLYAITMVQENGGIDIKMMVMTVLQSVQKVTRLRQKRSDRKSTLTR